MTYRRHARHMTRAGAMWNFFAADMFAFKSLANLKSNRWPVDILLN
jgi:hypothetical protein